MSDWRVRSQRLGCYLVTAMLVLEPAIASAQMPAREELPATSSRPGILATVLHFVDNTPPQSSPAPQRDSLKNGALIGAVVGAAAMGTFGAFLCYGLDDTGDPDCVADVLGFAALGAGIGVGAGLAVDVLRVRDTAPAIGIRYRF